jgi:Restriction Endonuclease associating with ARP
VLVSYQSRERRRLAEFARNIWQVEGHVLPYELAAETLHERVRETALAYFKKHKIKWWTSRWDTGRPPPDTEEAGLPTGHLNSSQVACVNHLEPARLDREFARGVARNVDEAFVDVQPVEDGGFVAYEWIGEKNYLGEPGPRVRGANITSLDGLMCAERSDGMRVLLVIEWKYLESYGRESVATSARGTDRVATYTHLLEEASCPIKRGVHQRLFFEPYYQLMRQTLLAWQMVEHGEFGASDWLHVHVVPEQNVALRGGGRGAPELVGETMADKWRSALKQPERYVLITPTELLAGAREGGRWSEWRRWLRERYET